MWKLYSTKFFFFQIKINGEILPDSVLNNLKISYIQNGTKKYISDLGQAVDYYANMGIMTTRSIGSMGVQSYNLEYNNGFATDTLFADYSSETPSTNCQYLLRQIKFNNITVVGATTFSYQPVYVFYKK